MKAFILAAGLGTRLKPWTLTHPKALVPVGGVPMLQRVIERLRDEGFDRIVVNVHHFADQIIDFLAAHDFGIEIRISDERERLLDTGGAIRHAAPLLLDTPGPVLVHNVDILSDASLSGLMRRHDETGAAATLLTSPRESSRRLVFDGNRLCGWMNLSTGAVKPEGFVPTGEMQPRAFSGIHAISTALIESMHEWPEAFSIVDFYLARCHDYRIEGYNADSLKLIDIGKPDTLARANSLFAPR